ncbi:hypothetical protein [Streptomyces sp. NPDC005970]|uniref:zinc finger domain-containing protein n=1 Tax=Streptomyces sp. NPDC005970 TaxID=3156723 RepID=UPI0033E6B67E
MTGQPAHPEHAIRCPWCGAPPKQRCASPRGRKLAIPSHDARVQAWANCPKENA